MFKTSTRLLTSRSKSFYDLLGLKPTASQAQIKTAYYEKAKALHPDTGKSADVSAFHELAKAYETLSDPEGRAEYDKSLNLGQSKSDNSYFTSRENFRPHQTNSKEWPRRPYNNAPNYDMSHIKFVYKTLNKEGEPAPEFRPFVDHHYPNSNYNRYEYSRRWDPERRSWIYTHRNPRERFKYEKTLRLKHRDLQYVVGAITMLILGTVFSQMIPR